MNRRARFEIVRIDGEPSRDERQEIEAAVAQLLESERRASAPSLWARAGRAQGRRLGMLDYRDRFTPHDVWRLSVRMPFGGREYPGLNGRADAK
ncbi:MAG: hypothetical protein M3P18_19855 [Actinomycetota bacterium]|nr:hypothetical protein [Actinomycetota bacterium]